MRKIPTNKQIIIRTKQGEYVAQWSVADNMFAYANPQIDMFEGKWDCCYYDTEYIKSEDIESWRDL